MTVKVPEDDICAIESGASDPLVSTGLRNIIGKASHPLCADVAYSFLSEILSDRQSFAPAAAAAAAAAAARLNLSASKRKISLKGSIQWSISASLIVTSHAPQLTVRRATLAAASRLLSEFPGHHRISALWVRCTLPLLYDTERSIQDSALDSFCSALLSCAEAIGSAPRADSPSAVGEARRLRPLLAAIAREGGSKVSCLGVGCNAAKGKGMVRAVKAAAGVERVIDGALDVVVGNQFDVVRGGRALFRDPQTTKTKKLK